MIGLSLLQRIQLALGLRLDVPVSATPRVDQSRLDNPPEEYFQHLRVMRETWGTVLSRIEHHLGQTSLGSVALSVPCDQLAALLFEVDRLQRIGTNTIAELIQEKHTISSEHMNTIHELHTVQQRKRVLERQLADASLPRDALRERREKQFALLWHTLEQLQQVADQVVGLWSHYYALGSAPQEVQNVMRDMIDKTASSRRVLDATEGSGQN